MGGEGALLKTVNAAEVGQLTWQTLDSGLTNPSRITFTAITCACPVPGCERDSVGCGAAGGGGRMARDSDVW